jgi:hypothetical protein
MTQQTPNADLREYEQALEGIDFPASRIAIHRKAADTGGLDTEVLLMLDRIPDRTYTSVDDVLREVQRAFAEQGGMSDGGPAAPATTDVKKGIDASADTRQGEQSRRSPPA